VQPALETGPVFFMPLPPSLRRFLIPILHQPARTRRTTMETSLKKILPLIALAMATSFSAGPALAKEVGKVGVDWLGNDIIIEAVADPEISGVTCHVTY